MKKTGELEPSYTEMTNSRQVYVTDVQKVSLHLRPTYMQMCICIWYHKPIYLNMTILAQFYENYYCKKLNVVCSC